ncbi:TetR/AcrR family transcriptional regulator [Jeotgalibacillus sp. JSM ZJ347]|uniref:TetR/AcrR family transcriptional regulator n=1 Tax=Jeotgalibacillus sp. JSM ZJ347 TaxID=3342117 RepID=UPI0035A902F2
MNKKAEQRRSQLLKAAFNAAFEKGYEFVTLQDISDYAGVSKGVTSYYFKNKAEVFSQLFEWLTDRIYEKETASVKERVTALEKLDAYINQVFINPEDNSKFYRVYLDFLSHTKQNHQYKMINDKFYKNCWSIGHEIISQGIEEGVFGVDDVEQASISMRCMIDGSLIQWLMREDDALHRYYKQACQESILQILHVKEKH